MRRQSKATVIALWTDFESNMLRVKSVRTFLEMVDLASIWSPRGSPFSPLLAEFALCAVAADRARSVSRWRRYQIATMAAIGLRRAQHYILVNGGVLACAAISDWASKRVLTSCGSDAVAAAAGTAVLYGLVFAAAAINLRGRRRAIERHASKVDLAAPIAFSSVIAHPIGSAFERLMHQRYMAGPTSAQTMGAAAASTSSLSGSSTWLLAMLLECSSWWLWLVLRLLAFELVFDGLFYCAHRLVHAGPRICEQAKTNPHAVEPALNSALLQPS